jgi:hypothetical protein
VEHLLFVENFTAHTVLTLQVAGRKPNPCLKALQTAKRKKALG